MGDDLQDLPVLRRAGFSAAPADAAPEVRAAVQWVSAERRRARRGARVHRARAARAGALAHRRRRTTSGRDGHAVRVLLVGLVALLVGLAVGKAWERYKLQDGVWIDRRRARESPHYMLGLNFLVANQIDQAIDELSKAAQAAGDPLEIHLILGNLYREKGQVGRAIQEHQTLLQRPNLRKLEHANVLLCLGLDYRSGGFVDRAIEAFTEVLKLDPRQPLRAVEPREAATRISTSGTRPTRCASSSRRSSTSGRRAPIRRGTTRSSRSSRTSSARRR